MTEFGHLRNGVVFFIFKASYELAPLAYFYVHERLIRHKHGENNNEVITTSAISDRLCQ